MRDNMVTVWNTEGDRLAYERVKSLEAQAKYLWVARKLRSVRLHILETHTHTVPYDRKTHYITMGDAS